MSDQGSPQDPGGWDPTQPPPEQPPAQPPYQPPPPYAPPPQYGQQPGYGETTQLPQYGQQPGYGDTSQLPQYGQPAYGAPPPPPGGPGGPGVPGQEGGHSRRGLFAGLGVAAVAILAVLAYFLFFAGSSAATPKETVKKFLEAGKSLDVKKAQSLLCSRDQNNPSLLDTDASSRVVSYRIGATTKKDGSHAVVHVSVVSATNPEPVSTDLPVVKEGGKWRVCLSDLIPTSGGSTPSAGSSGGPTEPSTEGSTPTDTSLPSGIPTGLPSGIPSNLPGGGTFCPSSSDALTTATTYIGTAEVGFTSIAQGCVWHDSVPESVTAKLKGVLFSPEGEDKTGGNGHGPKAIYDFASLDGKTSVTVTVTKESDGKYYVTGVQIH